MAHPGDRRRLEDGGTNVFNLVVARNVGKRPVTLRHRLMGDVEIKPGRQRTIPMAIAFVNLGNPSARDSTRERARTEEFKQVRRKWGFNDGFFSESAWFGEGTDNITGKPVGPCCPPIECYTLEGERMWFVHDDPDGTRGTGEYAAARAAADSDTRFTDAAITDLQAQIRDLKALIAAKTEPEGGVEVEPVGPSMDDAADALRKLGFTPEAVEEALSTLSGSQPSIVLPPDAVQATPDPAVPDPPQSQADRNEVRADDLPEPPTDEPPLKPDKPASPRVGTSQRTRKSD